MVRIATDIKPTFVIQRTNAQNYNPGITFDEAGVSFDDSRFAFGGKYESDIVPMIDMAQSVRPAIAGYFDIYTTVGTAPLPPANSGMLIGILSMTYP